MDDMFFLWPVMILLLLCFIAMYTRHPILRFANPYHLYNRYTFPYPLYIPVYQRDTYIPSNIFNRIQHVHVTDNIPRTSTTYATTTRR